MTRERSDHDDLDALDRELLIMLLPSSLREELIAVRIAAEDLTPLQLTTRLHSLANRGLVAHVQTSWASIWCLTKAGRAVAERLERQEELTSQHRQPTLFDHQEGTS